MDKVQKRFVDYATFYGKKTGDMNYFNQESVLLEIPGTNFPLLIPYLLTYKEVQLSGVLR